VTRNPVIAEGDGLIGVPVKEQTLPSTSVSASGERRHGRYARVSLRRANARDCELVWEWSFFTELRERLQATMTPRVVLFKDFRRWFAERLADRQTPVWIVEDAGASVGVMLIDRHDKQALPRLTIVLSSRGRGRGIGRRALALLCEQWQRPLIAEVSADNSAGVRSFEAAGFGRASERQLGERTLCTYLWSPQ
jgi:L-amino acid N-acyltransferase YncA